MNATGDEKSKYTSEYLGGFSFDQIRQYLDQITPEIEGVAMHIDHIVPLFLFNNLAHDELQQRMASHPTNLRRCTVEENLLKGAQLWFTSQWYGERVGWIHIINPEFIELYKRFHDDDGIIGYSVLQK